MLPAGAASPAVASAPEAEEFVRFCYARRRVGWPELYDEMCAVASRGLFRGMGSAELAEVGIGFSLFETPRLAALVQRLVAEEQARRARARTAAIEAAAADGRMEVERGGVTPVEPPAPAPVVPAAPTAPGAGRESERPLGMPRLVLAATA